MSLRNPIPIIIVGPSGVGKSTIIERIAALFPQVETFKTTTTRAPRHSADNRYHFVSREEFEQMIKDNEFLEWTETHGNLYGTERKIIDDIIDRGKFPLPSNAIDVVGVEAYKKKFPDLLAIFIAYDSLEELPRRIRRTRPEASEDEINKRLATAKEEMSAVTHFEYVVRNHEGKIDESVAAVANIIVKALKLQPAH